MKLLAVEAQGFRSFVERMKFSFPDHAGLFFVRGENKAQPSLGANGSGKSTFWDLISWCFYGKTARGLGGPHVESWYDGAPSPEVTIDVEVDGRRNTIRRTRKPITLTLNGTTTTQEEIDDLLAMSHDRFLQVALMGQFGVMFTDMKPTQRLDLVSEVLELELWSKAATHANQATAKLVAKKALLENVIERCKDRIADLETQKERVGDDNRRWQESQDTKLADAKRQYIKSAQQFEDSRATLAKLDLQVAEEEKAQARATRKLKEHTGSCGPLMKQREKLEGDRRVAAHALNEAQQQVRDIAEIGPTCDACRQEVPHSHIDELTKKAERELKKAQRDSTAAEAALSAVDSELAQHEKVRRELSVSETEAMGAVGRAAKKLREVTREYSNHESAMKLAEQAAGSLQRAQNPFTSLAEQIRKDISETELELTEQQSTLCTELDSLQAMEPWPKRFKELRLWVVEQALDELEIEVNSSMVELGLKGWKIRFVVERETQAGGISRGFEILVFAPGSPEGVPWEAWSGGESQRLRIACAVGLANLIRSKMPSAPVFEAWDEPTSHLNREGVDDLIEFMGARARTRQVWVIDHRSLDSGKFDGTMTVTKGKAGSRLTFR